VPEFATPSKKNFCILGASTLQITGLLDLNTPAVAASYSHLNLAAMEMLVDAVFAGIR